MDNINARKAEKDQINVHEAFELRYWSNKFGVTKERLFDAVRHVGSSASEVEKYLIAH